MTAELTAFHDLSPVGKLGVIVIGILVWVAGVWLLNQVYKTFR